MLGSVARDVVYGCPVMVVRLPHEDRQSKYQMPIPPKNEPMERRRG